MKFLMLVLLFFPCFAFAETSISDVPTEPATHLVSVEIGALQNGTGSELARFSGFGLKYAHHLAGGLFSARDELTAEAGVFYYSVVNYTVQGDLYSIVPVSAVLQYGRAFGESFRPYLYAGAMKNFSVSESNATADAQRELSSFEPAVGVGFSVFFKGMIARVDLGTDLFGAGLAYAF